MNTYLGIAKRKKLLKLTIGSKSFWCGRKSFEIQAGDILLLYFTGCGISQIYRIEMPWDENEEFLCEMRNMQTMRTILIANLENPISAKQMKSSPVLKEMGAVRRNFQGTTFRIKPDEWRVLEKTITKSNPKIETYYKI